MAPPLAALLPRADAAASPSPSPTKAAKPTKSDMSQMGLIVEAWAEGLMVGSLVILMLIVVCNLRRHVLLHKLILIEVRTPERHAPLGTGRLTTTSRSNSWPSGMGRSYSSTSRCMAGQCPFLHLQSESVA